MINMQCAKKGNSMALLSRRKGITEKFLRVDLPKVKGGEVFLRRTRQREMKNLYTKAQCPT